MTIRSTIQALTAIAALALSTPAIAHAEHAHHHCTGCAGHKSEAGHVDTKGRWHKDPQAKGEQPREGCPCCPDCTDCANCPCCKKD